MNKRMKKKPSKEVSLTPALKQKFVGNTQSKVLDAYVRLCYRLGIHQVTLEKIAAESGVSFGTVRYHFRNPNAPDLITSAVNYVYSKAQRDMQTYLMEEAKLKGPDFHPLIAYVEGTIHWLETLPWEGSFLAFYYYLLTTQVGFDHHADPYLSTARTRLVSLLFESYAREGKIPPRNCEQIAQILHTFISGKSLLLLSDRQNRKGDRISPELLRNTLAEIKLLLAAVASA